MLIAGVDEAGVGPLAGPVVAGAVILDPGKKRIKGLRDSKLLPAPAREELAAEIRSRALAWAIGVSDVAEIDSLNILHATLLAMSRAVGGLTTAPEVVWIDGLRCPPLDYPTRAIVDGDRLIAEIAAASILAKTTRDAVLVDLDRSYPIYGFARHKGYSTREHLAALATHGPCPAHRRYYAPVIQTRFVF
ncbi:MAG: ribonuclease HII [Betaproteobacteria bacterium]|nr:MAG: ribonuclease HII [Betaproteobacteria bacterium]